MCPPVSEVSPEVSYAFDQEIGSKNACFTKTKTGQLGKLAGVENKNGQHLVGLLNGPAKAFIVM